MSAGATRTARRGARPFALAALVDRVDSLLAGVNLLFDRVDLLSDRLDLFFDRVDLLFDFGKFLTRLIG